MEWGAPIVFQTRKHQNLFSHICKQCPDPYLELFYLPEDKGVSDLYVVSTPNPIGPLECFFFEQDLQTPRGFDH